MRQSIHKLVIGSLLAGALALSGIARLTGAGGQVWHVPGDFPTIQAAVDAAAEGDTILVAPGVYTEHVVVSKSHLTLRGAGPVSPVERPSVSASENVVLDGADLGGLGIGINVIGASADAPVIGVEVSQFEVRNFERGIIVQRAVDARLSHNYVHDNLDKVAPVVLGDATGIELLETSASDVSHNLVSRNGISGINARLGSFDNAVHHNRVFENGPPSRTTGQGVLLTGAGGQGTTIEYNVIEGNNGRGIIVTRPTGAPPMTGVLIAHNQAHGNQRAGIAIMGAATDNIVVHNDARDNNLSGLGPCRRCNLFDASVGRNGGNIWDNNLGIFGSPGDPCAVP